MTQPAPNAQDVQALEAEPFNDTTTRFGIGEWYGRPFLELRPDERARLADYKPSAKAKLTSSERARLVQLREKARLSERERARLAGLESKFQQEGQALQLCPFRTTSDRHFVCSKTGGVCSLRLYQRAPNGKPVAAEGTRGGLRVTCPNRFHDGGVVAQWVGQVLLGTDRPKQAGEVGFLSGEGSIDGTEGGDVGRFDMVLVNDTLPDGHPLTWAAVEIQGVYFSGNAMESDFRAIAASVVGGGSGNVWPTATRRPDYRSSGPKRLMPQLQTKVPTLRRWGKKMAVVVDRPFFKSMGRMESVGDVSNGDIAWFVVDFRYDTHSQRYQVMPGEVIHTTLEESVKGLTGGQPVSQPEFEARIRSKLAARS